MPFKSAVVVTSSKKLKKSHCATAVGITVYIAIQMFLPFSHNFTPVNTACYPVNFRFFYDTYH